MNLYFTIHIFIISLDAMVFTVIIACFWHYKKQPRPPARNN